MNRTDRGQGSRGNCMCKGLEGRNKTMDMGKLRFHGILVWWTPALSVLLSFPKCSLSQCLAGQVANVWSLLGEGWEASLSGGTTWESRSLGGLPSLLGTTRKEAQIDSVLPLSAWPNSFTCHGGRFFPGVGKPQGWRTWENWKILS